MNKDELFKILKHYMVDNIRNEIISLINQQSAEIEQLKAENEKLKADNDWISGDILPTEHKEYLCRYRCDKNSNICFWGILTYFAYDENPHWQHESMGLIVDFYQPLPNLPKEDK